MCGGNEKKRPSLLASTSGDNKPTEDQSAHASTSSSPTAKTLPLVHLLLLLLTPILRRAAPGAWTLVTTDGVPGRRRRRGAAQDDHEQREDSGTGRRHGTGREAGEKLGPQVGCGRRSVCLRTERRRSYS